MLKMLKEEWCDIKGYEDLYQVSDRGRVRSLDRYVRWGNREFLRKGIIRKLCKDRGGYLIVVLSKEGKHRTQRAHTLVLTAFHRPPKDNEECNHIDGDKSNNHIENLEWCTPKENQWHRNNVLGKHSRGENQVTHVLTDQYVREIRVLCKEGNLTQKQIAEIYNVHEGTISWIKSGEGWKHLK